MKKVLSVLALVTLLGITSCGPTSNPTSEPSVDPTVTPSVSNPSTPDDPILYSFKVKVIYEDATCYIKDYYDIEL